MQAEIRFEEMLDAIGAAVRQADFAALEGLLPEFEECLSAFPAGVGSAMLPRLQIKAQRNAELLQAAARGIRAARQRLWAVVRGTGQLATYDGNGLRSELPAAGPAGRRV